MLSMLKRNTKSLLVGEYLKKLVIDNGGVYFPMNEASNSVTQAINPALATGRDLLINGTFASDTIWTKGTGWTIADGVASCDGSQAGNSNLYQATTFRRNAIYEVTFTVSNYSAGTVKALVAGSDAGTLRSADGTYVENITNVNGIDGNFYLQADVSFIGDIDNVSVKQKTIAASTDFPGSEELTDGDMENAGVGDWTAINNATLTKETTDPQEGSQVLRIAYSDTNNPYAIQGSIMTIGKRYRITGYMRGDGTVTPSARNNALTIFTGTSSTSWQFFDEEFTAVAARLDLRTNATSAGYAEFDDISITEVNPLNGDITGATIGVSAGAKLKKAYTFDGANDYSDIYSAEINSIFDPTKGTLLAFAKVSGSGVWTDGAARHSIAINVDTSNNNFLRFFKAAANNSVTGSITFGGTNKSVTKSSFSPTDFFMLAMTWDTGADAMIFYVNGVKEGSTQTGLGTFVGNLGSAANSIGASNTTPANVWDGDVCHAALLTEVLSPTEIFKLAKSGGVA